MNPVPGQPGGPGPAFNAMAGSWVGAQIGVVHGDVYQPGSQAPPEELFRFGVRELGSNNRLSALRFLEKAFEAERTPEHAYYLMLAILSDRPYELLGEKHMELLRQAAAFADAPDEPGGAGGPSGPGGPGGPGRPRAPGASDDPDGHRAAIGIVCRLLSLVSRPPEAVHADGSLLALFEGVDALPASRRSEILQHLQMLMNGAVRDRLDAWDAAEVRENRRAGRREARAHKFFLPDPVAPKQRTAAPAGLTGVDQAALAGAAVLGVVGFALALAVLLRGSVATAFFVLLAVGAGGAAAAWCGVERRWLGERLAEENRRHFPSTAGQGPWHHGAVPFDPAVVPGAYRIAWPTRQYEDFHTAISHVIAAAFESRLRQGEDPSAWARHSAGIRLTLANELTVAFAGTNSTAGLEWLVGMHAEDTAVAWRNGTLFDYQRRLRTPVQISFGFWAGVVCFGIGALAGVGDLFSLDAGKGFGAVVVLAAAVLLGLRTGYEVHARRRTRAADVHDFGVRYENELRVWQQWRDYLADRPTDNEMAKWLDYDLRALRRESLDHYGLSNHDVRTSFFVTEAAPGCHRARVRCGPPRYSSYIIRLFLLTEGGVRQHRWTMDFVTADHFREDRTAFRYDAIGSVAVAQVSIRGVGELRKVVRLDKDSAALGTGTRPQDEVILGQALCLSLLNSESIEIVVENFRDFVDRIAEDPAQLYQLALDSSGISTALRILESVAAEGRDWFAAQRASIQRRLGGANLLATSESRGLAPGTNGEEP
ncbi:hypothetical protein ABZ896_14810 [Streptomyces sp. NPDC047072]|uniref:hypothetical protein n=1 Tax=Streptomyces sp. NPDC047072 TaxID=3154809 RepID=UPI0033E6E714